MTTETTTDTGAQALADFSDGLAAAVEKAGASLVSVNARRRFPATGMAWDNNTIITSDHVIEREENIIVTLPGGTEVTATLVGRDPGSDIAVLRVPDAVLVPAERATSAAKTGQIVLALGRPGPGGPMASFGVVSFSGGPWRTFRGAQISGYLRSDTTFYPGFSGGPLINVQGQVLGMNSSKLGQGQGLTLPLEALESIGSALASGGRLKRGFLGISSQVVRLTSDLSGPAGGQETGLLLISVEPESPAAKSLMLGDIVVAADGEPLTSTEDLQAHLGSDSVGRSLAFRIFRGGALQTVTVTPTERTQG